MIQLNTAQEFERLVDDIVSGESVRVGLKQFCLSDLIAEQPLIDANTTLARLIGADRDTRIDILSQAEKQSRVIVEQWLRSDPYGIAALRVRIEESLEEML